MDNPTIHIWNQNSLIFLFQVGVFYFKRPLQELKRVQLVVFNWLSLDKKNLGFCFNASSLGTIQ